MFDWERVARDAELAYPENGIAIELAPLMVNAFRLQK